MKKELTNLTDEQYAVYNAVCDGQTTCGAMAAKLHMPASDTYLRLNELISLGLVKFQISDDGPKIYTPNAAAEEPADDLLFHEYTYEQQSAAVLKCIDDLYCTLPLISRHLHLSGQSLVQHVLDRLVSDKKLEVMDGPGYAVGYFRAGRLPKRFWLEGNKCGVQYADEKAEAAAKAALIEEKQKEMDARPPVFKPEAIDAVTSRVSEAFGENVADLPEDADLDELFGSIQFGSSQLPGEELAAWSEDGDVSTDLENGDISSDDPASSDSVSQPVTSSGRPGRRPAISLTPEAVEYAAFLNGKQGKTATALGFSRPTGLVKRLDSTPELKDAYERGIARHKAQSSDLDNAAKTPVEPCDRGRSECEARRPEPSPLWTGTARKAFRVPVDATLSDQTTSVGDFLTITYRGNIFTASARERQLVNDIAELIEDFQDPTPTIAEQLASQ